MCKHYLFLCLLLNIAQTNDINPICFDDFTAAGSVAASANKQFDYQIVGSDKIWHYERDISVSMRSIYSSDDSIACTIGNGSVFINSHSHSVSVVTLQYDGKDSEMKFTNTTAPENFYDNMSKGFQLHVITQQQSSALIFVYTREVVCSYEFAVYPNSYSYYIDFLYFRSYNKACNFSEVYGVELNVITNTPNIVDITFFGTFAQTHLPHHVDDFLAIVAFDYPLSQSNYFPLTISQDSLCCFNTILGGQRDSYFLINGINGASVSRLYSNISNTSWKIETGAGFQGFGVLQYDGVDVSDSIQYNGLGNLDFTDGNTKNAIMLYISTNSTIEIRLSVHRIVNYVTSTSQSQTVSVPPSSFTTAVFKYATFSPSVDFTNIGALEIMITLQGITSVEVSDVSFFKSNS